jgi:hypothetical protein
MLAARRPENGRARERIASTEDREGVMAMLSYAHAGCARRCSARRSGTTSSFGRLWFEEVSASVMRRTWLRAVAAWTQTGMTIGQGNPRDAQHAAYLIEADPFLTGDDGFRRVLERVRPWCPSSLPRARSFQPRARPSELSEQSSKAGSSNPTSVLKP